jgi:heat shock protein HslJ
MKMKKITLLMIAMMVFAALMVGACSGNTTNSPVGDWKLVSYGSAASPTPAAAGVDTTITFASNGQVTGNVGCNSFGGDYSVSGSQITFKPITSTLMACGDAIDAQEAEVLRVFAGTATFQVAGDTLTITTADGASVVVLERK